MDQSKAVVPQQHKTLVEKFAAKYTIESGKLLGILKATAFKVSEGKEVSNEQMAALLVVADQYGLNPFTKEIFAFEDKRKGIVPVVSVDGWARIINEHPDFNGCEFVYGPECTSPDNKGKKAFEWVECVMHHKKRAHPIRVREYLDEVYQGPRSGYDGPWQTHTKRMQRHKSYIQTGRLAFGFSGIYDEDEAQRIIDAGGGTPEAVGAGDQVRTGVVVDGPRSVDETPTRDKGRDVEDAEVVTQATPETIKASINAAKSQTDLQPILQQITALGDTPDRAALMKEWNAAVMKLKGEVAPKAKPAAKPAGDGFAKPTKSPGDEEVTDALCTKVCKEIAEAKDIDALELIADRENKRKWTDSQRETIYNAYMQRRDELSPPDAGSAG